MTVLSGKLGDFTVLLKYMHLSMSLFSPNSSTAMLHYCRAVAAPLFPVGIPTLSKFEHAILDLLLCPITNDSSVPFYALNYAAALRTFVVAAQQLSIDIDPYARCSRTADRKSTRLNSSHVD